MRSRTARRTPQKRRKRKKAGFGLFIFIVVLVVVLAAGGTATYKYLTANDYDNESSFERYADRYFSSNVESDDIGDTKTEYSYGEYASNAIQYPQTGIENVDAKITQMINDEQNDFKSKFGSSGDGKVAMLTCCDTYKSDKGTGSVVVKTSIQEEDDKGKLVQVSNKAKTFTFNTENGSEVFSLMAFEPGYRDKLADFFKSEGFDKAAGTDVEYDKFALTGNDAIFYFDAGQIEDSDTLSEIKVKNNDVDNLFKDEIDARGLDPSKPMVAITYDDGPKKGTTDRILKALQKNGAVATFFELGENVDNCSESENYLKTMEKQNCEIGSHSYDHPNLFKLSDSEIKAQNDKTDKAIESRIGKKPTVYRPPFGNGDEKTTKIFGKPGILWSVDTLDWKSRNADAVVGQIKSSGNLDGKVILMHSIYDSSAEATERILPWLQSQGYQTVTVSELLMYKYKEDPSVNKFYGYNYFYLN